MLMSSVMRLDARLLDEVQLDGPLSAALQLENLCRRAGAGWRLILDDADRRVAVYDVERLFAGDPDCATTFPSPDDGTFADADRDLAVWLDAAGVRAVAPTGQVVWHWRLDWPGPPAA